MHSRCKRLVASETSRSEVGCGCAVVANDWLRVKQLTRERVFVCTFAVNERLRVSISRGAV